MTIFVMHVQCCVLACGIPMHGRQRERRERDCSIICVVSSRRSFYYAMMKGKSCAVVSQKDLPGEEGTCYSQSFLYGGKIVRNYEPTGGPHMGVPK